MRAEIFTTDSEDVDHIFFQNDLLMFRFMIIGRFRNLISFFPY